MFEIPFFSSMCAGASGCRRGGTSSPVRLVPVDLVRVREVEGVFETLSVRYPIPVVQVMYGTCTASPCRTRDPAATPDVREVREVTAVQRLETLSEDEPTDAVFRREEDVELDRPRGDLRDRLVRRREERLLDVDAVLLAEALLDLGIEIAVPVVDAERAAFGIETRRDHRIVLEEGLRDRVLGARQIERRGRELPVVSPPQAASSVLRLDSPTTPTAERPRNSRRPYLDSRGCIVSQTSQAVVSPPSE
jgi:hypothetical protein